MILLAGQPEPDKMLRFLVACQETVEYEIQIIRILVVPGFQHNAIYALIGIVSGIFVAIQLSAAVLIIALEQVRQADLQKNRLVAVF